MAENLNYAAEGSVCYDNKPANCVTYGRLYDFETAKRVCPAGWRLPADVDWDKLENYAGGETAGKKLKSRTANGTDKYGFSALLGGIGYGIYGFDEVGGYGYWWGNKESRSRRATEISDEQAHAWCWSMERRFAAVSLVSVEKVRQLSIRCVEDDVKGGGNDQ